jgi:predicted DNA-binding WGR domain protein
MRSTWTKIDPTKNCFRFYAITLASDLFNAYVVSCEWGRIGGKRNHRKVEVFDFKADAVAYIQQLEKLRLKHHYQIAD